MLSTWWRAPAVVGLAALMAAAAAIASSTRTAAADGIETPFSPFHNNPDVTLSPDNLTIELVLEAEYYEVGLPNAVEWPDRNSFYSFRDRDLYDVTLTVTCTLSPEGGPAGPPTAVLVIPRHMFGRTVPGAWSLRGVWRRLMDDTVFRVPVGVTVRGKGHADYRDRSEFVSPRIHGSGFGYRQTVVLDPGNVLHVASIDDVFSIKARSGLFQTGPGLAGIDSFSVSARFAKPRRLVQTAKAMLRHCLPDRYDELWPVRGRGQVWRPAPK